MKAFKGKFKDKKFTGSRADVDNIISTLSGTPIESKGSIYDAGHLVKKIKTDLLNGKILMPRKLMQALSRAKENV